MSLEPDDPRHGTLHGYVNLKCRCDLCRQTNADDNRAMRRARRIKGLNPDDPRHGFAATYSNWGCRCEPCSIANREKMRAFRQKREAS